MSKNYIYFLHIFFILGLLFACGKSEEDKSNNPAKQSASPHAKIENNTDSISGVVLETMDAGGYTYVQVDTGTEKIWAAGPLSSVDVGMKLSISKQMPMINYHSKSLNRDFELLYFVGSLGEKKEISSGELQKLHANLGDLPEAPIDIDIKKAEDGKNIAEIITEQEQLSGQAVRVRGKVVKYNYDIMGKDWIHIRDGSSDNDLTITTNDKVALGDIILAEGKIVLNKDYGSGYVYKIVMEDAKITVEHN